MLLGFDSFAESPLDGAPFQARTALTQVTAASSNFQSSALQNNAKWQRILTIGTSDYSARVVQWPTIDKTWNNINPGTVLIDLANDDRALNFILNDPINLQASCVLGLGFAYPQLLQYSENWVAPEWHYRNCTVSSATGGFKITKSTTGAQDAVFYTAPNEFSASLSGRAFNMRATIWTDSSQVGSVSAQLAIYDAASLYIGVSSITPTQTPTNYNFTYTFSSDTTSNFIVAGINPLGTCSGAYFYGNYAMLEEGFGTDPYLPSSGIIQAAEILPLFVGNIDAAQYGSGKLSLTVADKFMTLARHTVGNNSSAMSYTASQYMVHDMAWYICTSLGGLSSVRSTSNPDIDYTSFSSWSSLFSADNTRLQGSFTGQRAAELLQKVSNLTQSAIYVKNGLLTFNRFLLSAQPSIQLTDANVLDTIAVLDQRSTINQESVSAAYNVSSSAFGVVATWNNTSSIASYGLYADIIQESVLWLVDSISATNLAQRQIQAWGTPQPELSVTAPLVSLGTSVGDCLGYSDTHLQISAQTYRVMRESVNMEQGTKTYTINQTQLQAVFHLDVSAVDSADVLP